MLFIDIMLILGICILTVLFTTMSFEFFYMLWNEKDESSVYYMFKPKKIVLGLINGLIFICCTKYLNCGTCALVISFLVASEFYTLCRSNKIFHYCTFVSVLLNSSGAFIIVSATLSLFNNILWENGTWQYKLLVIIISLIIADLIMIIFLFTKLFPNKELGRLLRVRRERQLVFIYLTIFSLVDLFSLYFFIPKITYSNLPYDTLLPLVMDSNLKAFMMTSGSYLIILYLCKFSATDDEHKLLSAALKREQSFRQNVFSDSLIGFCISINKNTFEEGIEFFNKSLIEDGTSYSSVLSNFVDKCVNPMDKEVIIPYTDLEKIRRSFKNLNNFSLRIRVSPIMLLKYLILPNEINKLLANNSDEWIWIDWRMTETIDIDTGEDYLYVTVRDINKEVKDEAALRDAASREPLTGLYNRGGFTRLVTEYFSQNGGDGTLFIIDMDNFKMINDNLGHPEGDRVLVEISHILNSEFRGCDIGGRIGGDEFAVFAVGLKNYPVIKRRAETIGRIACKEFLAKDGSKFISSLSIGIAISPLHGGDFETLYKNADKALYKAKTEGKNRFIIYSDEIE